MIKSVVRAHHWTPDVINSLYHDSIDYFGLQFWYDDVRQVEKELKAKK